MASSGRSMLRSPSHESDLSSLSGSANNHHHHHRVSFAKSATLSANNGQSPVPGARRLNIPEIFAAEEDCNHLLKRFGSLAEAAGLPKSFSTSDILHALDPSAGHSSLDRSYVSMGEFQRFGGLVDFGKQLEQSSRSCSTWVAVGELASTSQLPSPHGTHSINSICTVPIAQDTSSASFSSVDLVRSVNKILRKNYIRRRIMMSYRVNMDQPATVLTGDERRFHRLSGGLRGVSPGPTELVVPNLAQVVPEDLDEAKEDLEENQGAARPTKVNQMGMCELELEKGRSLSRFERNMVVFNWLHSLALPLPSDDPT